MAADDWGSGYGFGEAEEEVGLVMVEVVGIRRIFCEAAE